MSKLRFFTSCPNWESYLPVEDLNSMIDKGKVISRKTFLMHVDHGSMKAVEMECGYDKDFPMTKDPYVEYFKSSVRGCPVVYFVWSAMEYVFADLACVLKGIR